MWKWVLMTQDITLLSPSSLSSPAVSLPTPPTSIHKSMLYWPSVFCLGLMQMWTLVLLASRSIRHRSLFFIKDPVSGSPYTSTDYSTGSRDIPVNNVAEILCWKSDKPILNIQAQGRALTGKTVWVPTGRLLPFGRPERLIWSLGGEEGTR